MTQRTEVSVPSELLERILKLAGTDMILVGGQALAFWSAYYQTPAPTIAITKDVDLLGTKTDVDRLARGLDARAVFPHQKDVTLLVGQVLKDLPGATTSISMLCSVSTETSPPKLSPVAQCSRKIRPASSALCIRSMFCRAASRTFMDSLLNRTSMVWRN